ncbi:HEAT repeat domain-containing protein [Rufibacter immobilis]|uniref:HEAT repeat domain-containing protein n=1 Tax=Rufibacter immobilis TaxID=1348778 RepID=A0A3M9N528_9BACT|nr:HEAT repeat domain-containing protein [Rufibacter immobilis]RNI32495.1 HEAT repeat domain-containing protein [Rufibacter immobilis]
MPFKQIETLLEKYYNGETSLEEENQLKDFFQQTKLLPDHLKAHAIQFEYYAQEQEVELDKFLADDWLFEKIGQPQMTASPAAPKEKTFFQQYAWQMAASISLLLVAFWAGNYFRQDSAPNKVAAVQEQPQTQAAPLVTEITPAPETSALAATETDPLPAQTAAPESEKEISSSPRRKTITVLASATVAHASASDRLQMVRQELETEGLTPQESKKVIRQLVKTMNQDNNVNVRLAACEALYRFKDRPEVRKAFIQALGTQTDPMMQLTLIEIVISLKEKNAVPHLQDLSTRDNLLPIIKLKAQEGLGTLI